MHHVVDRTVEHKDTLIYNITRGREVVLATSFFCSDDLVCPVLSLPLRNIVTPIGAIVFCSHYVLYRIANHIN